MHVITSMKAGRLSVQSPCRDATVKVVGPPVYAFYSGIFKFYKVGRPTKWQAKLLMSLAMGGLTSRCCYVPLGCAAQLKAFELWLMDLFSIVARGQVEISRRRSVVGTRPGVAQPKSSESLLVVVLTLKTS